ncbi:MAG: hypothetical protein ACYC3L_15085, partial [Gemmatimonadaceae bacterium]
WSPRLALPPTARDAPVEQAPKWFLPVAIVALLWNVVGCVAYLSDVMLSSDDLAEMTAAQQAMYAARPAWSVGATAVAVWGGAAGSVGLIMRKRWATPLLVASLAALVVQDVSFYTMREIAPIETSALALQGGVLLIGIGLVLLSRRAAARGWLA